MGDISSSSKEEYLMEESDHEEALSVHRIGISRPGPQGHPFAWAESRQELCETLPYYHAYQSGCYTKSSSTSSKYLKDLNEDALYRDATAYGYLLAGFGSPRDAWEHQGRVIISHGGGKSRSISNTHLKGTPQMQLKESQSVHDPRIASLIQSCKNQTPIILILASDYALSHFKLKCQFAVLGWYWITDHWCERDGPPEDVKAFFRIKFRFQYLEMQGNPWWLRDQSISGWQSEVLLGSAYFSRQIMVGQRRKRSKKVWTSNKKMKRSAEFFCNIVDSRADSTMCMICRKCSPLLFRGGWMCLSSSCSAFWKPIMGALANFDFRLHIGFLQFREEPAHFILGGMPFSLLPSKEQLEKKTSEIHPLSGLHCLCGRLSCRQYVGYWLCAHCGYTRRDKRALGRSLPTSAFSSLCLDDVFVNEKADISMNFQRWPDDHIEVMSFTMPRRLGNGKIHLIRSTLQNDEKVNELLKRFKRSSRRSKSKSETGEMIPFQRHELNCHTIKGSFLSQQFTCNYGAEYKHAVKMGTNALSDAPSCITDSLTILHDRTVKVISEDNAKNGFSFNEVYPVLYLDSQKMNFHDDGEPGLGPVISTLSLGVDAKMSFRIKEKYTREGTSSKSNDEDSDETLSMKDRIVLIVPLQHGSIVVQEGRLLQEVFEHAVQPEIDQGKDAVRIAITARQISQEN